MLVLTRKVDETLVISDNVVVRVLEIRGNNVRLGIEAPTGIRILRTELLQQSNRERAYGKSNWHDSGPRTQDAIGKK